jgi:hypothetical protein
MNEFKTWMQHAAFMETEMVRGMRRKYEAGQAEHGGKLWRKPMLAHMFAEIIDLANYYLTHLSQVTRTKVLLDQAIETRDSAYRLKLLWKARNMLIHGNEDGEEEEELNPDTWEED